MKNSDNANFQTTTFPGPSRRPLAYPPAGPLGGITLAGRPVWRAEIRRPEKPPHGRRESRRGSGRISDSDNRQRNPRNPTRTLGSHSVIIRNASSMPHRLRGRPFKYRPSESSAVHPSLPLPVRDATECGGDSSPPSRVSARSQRRPLDRRAPGAALRAGRVENALASALWGKPRFR